MKTYSRIGYCTMIGQFSIVINVPSPKELQATSQNKDVKVVTTNFSTSTTSEYSVASFEKETDEILIKMGFLFKTRSTNVYTFKGLAARQYAIDQAEDFLLGHN